MGARLKEDAGRSTTTGGIGPRRTMDHRGSRPPSETRLTTTEDETGMPCYSVYN